MTSRFYLPSDNSKVIASVVLNGFLSESKLIIRYYSSVSSIFESFKIIIDVNTFAARAQKIDTRNGSLIDDVFLGHLLPATSASGSLPYGSSFDLMLSICSKTLSISARQIDFGSLSPFDLSVSSFGSPVTFVDDRVSKATKLDLSGQGIVTVYFRTQSGIDAQCPILANVDDQNWSRADQSVLISALVLSVLSLVLLIILTILYTVLLYPVSISSLT